MKIFQKQLKLKTSADEPSFVDVTEQVREFIEEIGITKGLVAVISPHTTCSIVFEEHTPDMKGSLETLQYELNESLKKIIPDHNSQDTYIYPGEKHYQMVESWPNAADYLPGGDRSALWNGDAHLKSSVLGSSEVFDVADGKLGVGTTGYIYFVDFDTTRERERTCRITVIGE